MRQDITNYTNIHEIRGRINENLRSIHQPVLIKEVIQYLKPQPNYNFIDCTFGQGGHSLVILENTSPFGKILGIDLFREVIEVVKLKIKNEKLKSERIILVNDNFANLKKIVEKYRFKPVNGILLDLGLSSFLIEKSGQGFSFLRNEPLMMRYNQSSNDLNARQIINHWSVLEIERILREVGEEKFAKRIAKKIIEERKKKPIKTTGQLVEVIRKAVPSWYQRRKIHPATKTFQALRITVNRELENLKTVLPLAVEILAPEGRIVVISYHSLEDRIVKNYFREKSQQGILRVLTKKPVRPTQEEIEINPSSRSAKLRAATKL